MRPVSDKRLINSIVIAIAGVLAIVILSIWQYRRVQDNGGMIRHTNEVLFQTGEVLAAAMQYELNAKDFFLTGDSAYLHIALDSIALIPAKLRVLKMLTADNPVQQRRVDTLSRYAAVNREGLNDAIGLSRAGSSKAAHSGEGTGLSPNLAPRNNSYEMEPVIVRLQLEERRLLDRRRQNSRYKASELLWVLWSLIAAVLVLAFFIFRRVDLGREKMARVQPGRFNDQLAQEVRLRTADLQRLNEDLGKRAAELAASNAELAASNAELAASNTELERFAYIASHDLQEPLRMVSSFLQLLQKKYRGQLDAKADEYIHFAVDGAERMKALIMDLLEYSKVGTGKGGFGWVDTAAVMTEVEDIFREKIIAAGARIEIGPLPRVWGDKVQLAQLLQNLLSNALKYQSTEPPMIRIASEDDDDRWLFSVADNGIGIDPLFFDKIFIIFQRLHNRNDYSGTGIGLAICKKIVERHGGKIWVESDRRNGSTFFFSINKKM